MSGFETLTEIQEWAREEGINLSQDLSAGTAIHRRIQRLDFSASDIASYLCHPTFHPPGTSYILQLLPKLFHHTWEPRSWKIVFSSICKASELGLIRVNDLKAIITQIVEGGQIKLRSNDNQLRIVKNAERVRLVHGIIQSVARSKVLKVGDLGSFFLSELFAKLASNRTKQGRAVLWELMPWARAADAPVISELTLTILRDVCRASPHDEAGQNVVTRLKVVDAKTLRLVALLTTERLVNMTSPAYRYIFYHWKCALSVLGFTRPNVLLTARDWDLQRSYQSNMSIEQRLLVFAWTYMHLCQQLRTSDRAMQRQHFEIRLQRILTAIPETTREFLDRAGVGIRSLPFPNRLILLRHLKGLTATDTMMTVPDASPAPTDNTAPKPESGAKKFKKASNMSGAEYVDLIEELTDILHHNAPLFKILSRRMIQHDPSSFDLVCRILETNLPVKIAMSRRRPQQNSSIQERKQGQSGAVSTPVDVENDDHKGASRRSPHDTPVEKDSPASQEIIDLLNHLAVSFATSPVASPRRSLRRVHWCSALLHRYCGRLQPPITRALWHAGVTRYGGEGTAATLLRWILWKIKKVEGEGVARQLFWNDSFRVQRQLELEALSKVDEVEEQRLLAEEDQRRLPLHASSSSSPSLQSCLAKLLRPGVADDLELWGEFTRNMSLPLDEPFFTEKSKRRRDWMLNQGGHQARARTKKERETGLAKFMTMTPHPSTRVGR